ncbi:2-keto-4-pentenoate hydratase [Sphingosinicella sp. LY1275]|uniref:2-keto-4-pentenoate hydratase n=1 Tax=Sphingosinicella sp. LY1275 TaxID=3095379 RepID=UPI002ADED736|nr:2-keto-4-pentenoate hydratase [Sphingosinicella sp. LY1275]MEA1013042.1 2-keto-4-pentenoate hydratase [Sphingosinicella sp. LY1275]
MTDEAAAIAERFLAARRSASGLADYPGTLPETPDASYAIQDAAIEAWDKPVIGWKVGRILPPLSDRFGADRFAGPIFASATAAAPGDRPAMPIFAEGGAAVEAEFLLRIGTEPPAGQTRFTLGESADLIDRVHVGIEIASSPLRVLNALGPVAVISDFGNNNGLVIGPAIEDWRASGFEAWTVATRVDGVEVGSGQATAFPDGTIGAARFLFELMARRGIALRPGQWISSGAVSGVHDVTPGQTVDVRFGDRHEVGCSVTAARPE